MPTARSGGGYATYNGKIYIGGGEWISREVMASFRALEAYDPATDTWQLLPALPGAVHGNAMTFIGNRLHNVSGKMENGGLPDQMAPAVMNGKIYFFGGCQRPANGPGANGWAPVDNAWEYDPAADAYKALAPMPGKRCSAIAESVGGRIYVIGGVTTMDNTTDVAFNGQGPARVLGVNQVYDPAANTWTTKSAMPTGRNHAFSGVVNGKIYVIGGRIGHGFVTTSSNTDVVEEYDPVKDLWRVAKARMISPRSGGGWATSNGQN